MFLTRLYFNDTDAFSRNTDPRKEMFVESRDMWHSLKESINEALEDIFMQANAGNRKNGRYERSLSVGDVIEVVGHGAYVVRSVGFEVTHLPFDNIIYCPEERR